jgi:hypothetical protein
MSKASSADSTATPLRDGDCDGPAEFPSEKCPIQTSQLLEQK